MSEFLTEAKDFIAKYPEFNRHKLAYYRRQDYLNGLDKIAAITVVGKKMFIDEDKFFKWFNEWEKKGNKGTPYLKRS